METSRAKGFEDLHFRIVAELVGRLGESKRLVLVYSVD